MVEFNQWYETFVFAGLYSVIIIVPCILVAIVGRNLINRLGTYPTKTPVWQMGVFLKLISIEVVTFFFLISFYQLFSS